jgi:hypothetical protein
MPRNTSLVLYGQAFVSWSAIPPVVHLDYVSTYASFSSSFASVPAQRQEVEWPARQERNEDPPAEATAVGRTPERKG